MFLPVSLGLPLLGNWYSLLGLLCKCSALETKWRFHWPPMKKACADHSKCTVCTMYSVV